MFEFDPSLSLSLSQLCCLQFLVWRRMCVGETTLWVLALRLSMDDCGAGA